MVGGLEAMLANWGPALRVMANLDRARSGDDQRRPRLLSWAGFSFFSPGCSHGFGRRAGGEGQRSRF